MTVDNFELELKTRVDYINDILYGMLVIEDGKFERIGRAMNYSVRVGGKRLRPLLMLESYRLCGGRKEEEDKLHPFMAAMEFIHTYSLVHDDLPAMDNDLLRRGQPTTHAKFGEDFGILAGDGLLNLAYETMLAAILKAGDLKGVKAASVLANKAGIYGMVGGQCLDVDLTGKPIDKDELDFIFKLKTGALIEASFMMGGILAGANEVIVEKLCKAGELTGMAFQIRDDILDEIGNVEEIGKPVGSDEKNDKTTYVSLYGLEKAKVDVKNFLKEAEDILNSISYNEFLVNLLNYMVTRKK